jgi:predicted peptidase
MKHFFVAILCCLSFHLFGQINPVDHYEARWFVLDGDTLPYRILYPENYDRTKTYPLFLFLHGAGERGADNEFQLTHGATLFLQEENRKDYPCIVVFPQCPKNETWSWLDLGDNWRTLRNWKINFPEDPEPSMKLVMALLDTLVNTEAIDVNRQYVSGLSMGGFGTFDLLARQPKRFAAAAPICGGGNSLLPCLYKEVPIWVFHGTVDSVVPVENSRKMVAALKNCGAEVKYTEYPDYDHNSWEGAFAEPDFLKWFFSHTR